VEKKIKQGNVKCIGAYTITAIKENYRILPNLAKISASTESVWFESNYWIDSMDTAT